MRSAVLSFDEFVLQLQASGHLATRTVSPDDRLIEDFHLDSLDVLEIALVVEDLAGVADIDLDRAVRVESIRDLHAAYVSLAAKGDAVGRLPPVIVDLGSDRPTPTR